MVEGAGTRTAVVIDDDPDVRLMLRVALEATGFFVREAMTGRGGVDLVRESGADLVTLDLTLPDFGGVEACRQIREVTDAYIIMVTASSDEADRLVGLATGADDYVTKPFNPREIQARVVAMFRRPRTVSSDEPTLATHLSGTRTAPPLMAPPRSRAEAQPNPIAGLSLQQTSELGVLRYRNLVVDSESRVAWCENSELPLTKIEFDLLVTIVGNPRRIWRRETLLDIIWGGQWSDYHVVEVHIGNLRHKLADAAEDGAQLIRTVRGLGYRMASDHEHDPLPEDDDPPSGRIDAPSGRIDPPSGRTAAPSGRPEALHPDGPAVHSEAHQQL
jgi:two-component system OmpR family response regulator